MTPDEYYEWLHSDDKVELTNEQYEELEQQDREEYEAWRESCAEDVQFEELASETSEQFDDDYDSFLDKEDV